MSPSPDEHGLPGWVYSNSGFFAAERERVLALSPQVVWHLNDIPRAGDFHTFEFIGESILVVRRRDSVPRAFSNVCLHRAATLLDGPTGQCGGIVCPYHTWTYDLEGRLIGVPLRETYPDLPSRPCWPTNARARTSTAVGAYLVKKRPLRDNAPLAG